jgi:hypothetical protein
MEQKKEFNVAKVRKESTENPTPRYEPPKIATYTSEEILEQIGPAQACSPSPGCPIGD